VVSREAVRSIKQHKDAHAQTRYLWDIVCLLNGYGIIWFVMNAVKSQLIDHM
jgi:hypothetical protein